MNDVSAARSIPDLISMCVLMIQRRIEHLYSTTINAVVPRMPNDDEIEILLQLGKGLASMSSKAAEPGKPADGAVPLAEMPDDELDKLGKEEKKRK